MKIIKNRIVPFGKDMSAINLFGFLFVKSNFHMTPRELNHEMIHTAQMRELLYLPFYIFYFLEWLIQLVKFRFNLLQAYKNISFEREAYRHESNLNYLKSRKRFAQWL